jgi:hypothetical protein
MQVLAGIHTMTWAAVLVAVAATIEPGVSQTARAADVGESFTADVAIEQTHMSSDGRPLPGASPSARYRLEHRAGSSGATVLTLLSLERDTAEGLADRIPLDNPFLAVRMELDAKGGLRMFNGRGDRLREPTVADRHLFDLKPGAASGAADSREVAARGRHPQFVIPANGGADRRAALEEIFGKPVERVRGLDRYLSRRHDDVDEVLVDPGTVLPAELNTVRRGALVSRVQMAYEARANGTLLRRSLRAERTLTDDPRRIVTTIDISNVMIAGGGDR